MVGDTEERVLKVDHVTGHVKVHDLPAALLPNDLVPDGKAPRQKAAVSGRIALSHHVVAPSEFSHRMRKGKYCIPIRLIKFSQREQLRNERLEGVFLVIRHEGTLPH
jgi:hypothetical protein